MINNPIEDDWYDNQVVGCDSLNNAMKNLSQKAKLSQIYTNHCIRATVVTNLDEEGFEARHIMVISSHKSENSIKSYSSKCPENKKKQMFDALAKPFANPPHVPMKNIQNQIQQPAKVAYSERTQTPTLQENMPIQEPNFNLVDLFPNMDDEPLNDDNLLAAIEKIEQENAQIVPQNQTKQQDFENKVAIPNPPPVVPTTNTITSNYVQNVNRTMPTPHMFFPHSTVTINYNFNAK